ncbi:MAG: DNA topoisomerase (ATP-hydrolyzing) subunit B [Planctomycetota bacterium]|jgi:DNA gyrase subunit B
MTKEYGADSIKALEGLEAVRKRPGMYIGDTGIRGLHHLVYEVVDNCIDEAMAGHASHVSLVMNSDGSLSVTDDGRGIPVDWHKDKQMSALTVVLTVLHAGGKFDGESYKVSGGLHGVGISVVNALSEWLEVEVCRQGKVHFQRFERGIPQTEVEERGKTKRTGTKVVFKPDPEIFSDAETLDFDYSTLSNRMRELAFLNKGLSISIVDEGEEEQKDSFCYQGGIKSYVEYLNASKTPIHNEIIYVENRDEESGTEVEIALQYTDGYTENVSSFCNNINTHEGGTHLSGFRSAITRSINTWGKRNNVIKDDAGIQGDDCREGLSAIVSVRIPEPQFEGQTKTKLGNRNVQGITEAIVAEGLSTYFEEHPGNARTIINRAQAAAAARMAARKARDLARKKNKLSIGDLPGKLADCISKDPETTEVYLVEGDSAGGSAKVGRDNRNQAILPLRGKILNVEKNRLDKILENREISSIISALGTGIGRDEFDIEKLRYGKIVIMTDADVDGSHIRTLILTFLYRYLPELIQAGHVYIAQPPLYRVTRRKKAEYVLTEEDMNRSLLNLGLDGTSLEYRNNGSSFSMEGDKLKSFLADMAKLERLTRAVGKRNLTLDRYLEMRQEYGVFPKYRVMDKGEEKVFVDDAALKDYLKAQEAAGRNLEIIEEEFEFMASLSGKPSTDDENAESEEEPTEAIHLTEFIFCKEMEVVVKKVEAVGFTMTEYFPPHDPTEEGKFVLLSDKNEHIVRSLSEILDGTRNMGRRGLDIQRYKGLGEMNPDQLWETTMDPERRTLLQVEVGDAAQADSLFTILMGDLVAPRREFIEKNAKEVANLDV